MSPRSRVGKRTRQLLVFAHVAVSLGWMGAGGANVVLAVTAASTRSVEVRRVCYYMIDRIDLFVVIPGAFAALATGIVLSLVTPWGLTRYWWVLVKLVLTVAVIVYSTFGLGVWVIESIETTSSGTDGSHVAGALAYGAGANIVAFLFMTWASIAKPWGTTPWSTRGRASAAGRRPRSAAAIATDPVERR